jgi:hypothetical protein
MAKSTIKLQAAVIRQNVSTVIISNALFIIPCGLISKFERLAVYNIRLKFQEVFIVLGIIARFFVVFTGEFFNALITVPFGDGPEMALVAFDAAKDLDTQISRGFSVIADAGVDN